MKKEYITALFETFEEACYTYDGIECWSARELQTILGYSQWRNFENAIEKAKTSCVNAGEKVAHHFADVSKTIPMPKDAEKIIIDYALTRYACYLIAQNGDASKSHLPKPILRFKLESRKLLKNVY